MTKHWYLISKYQRNVGKNFMKTFRGFLVFVFMYMAKNENAESAKSFQNMPYRNLDFINVK